MVKKLKYSNCDKTKKKLKLWQKSKSDKKNSKTQNGTKFKGWQNLRTQSMMKLKNWNSDKSQKLQLWQNLKDDKSHLMKKKKYLTESFSRNILTPWQPMRCSLCSVLRFSRCFIRGTQRHLAAISDGGRRRRRPVSWVSDSWRNSLFFRFPTCLCTFLSKK